MKDFFTDQQFWLAIIGAAIVKVLLSDKLGWLRALSTLFIAIFGAWLLTDFVMAKLGVGADHRHVVGAAVALTAEQIARAVMGLDVKGLVEKFGKG